jgi:hypothetical protein
MIQATGRDVFSEAVLRLEDAGYIPVLSIHDEIVLEVPTGTDPQTIENIMAEPVPWFSCGNKTQKGARTWQTLTSLAATCAQRATSFIAEIARAAPTA